MALTVDEIAKILNDMRIENQSNSEIFEKLLTGINNKIEVLSVDNETADLLKLYVAELKKITEDNIANSSVKFDSLNSSITKILDVNSELAKNADVNEAFLNLSSNINELSRSFEDQKGKLLKLDDELSKVSSSFLNKDELSLLIANFSDNLQSINLNMKNSYGQIIKSLENTDNYLKSFDYSNQIINLSNQIDNVLSDVRDIPNKISFENLENKISYYQELLDSLRAVVDQISSDARLNIEKKFENIENLFKSIVTDSDFLEFKSNLADFIQKIIDNSSSLNIELNNNKKQIEKIIETLNILNFNDDFNNVVNKIDNLKADFLQGASINYENLSSEISGLEQSLNSSFENLGNSYKELYSDIKLEVTEILLNLKKVIELNPKSSIDELSSILTDALEDIHSIKQVIPNSFVDDINENANNNYEAVKEYIVELDASINKLKTDFEQLISNNISNLNSSLEVVNAELSAFRSEFKQVVETDLQNSANIIANISDLFSGLEEIKSKIENNLGDFELLINGFVSNISDDIAGKIEELNSTNQLNENQKIEILESVSKDIKNIKDVIDLYNQKFKDDLKASVVDLKNYIGDIGGSLSSANSDFENKLSAKLENIDSLNHLLETFSATVNSKFGDISDSLISLNFPEYSNTVIHKVEDINSELIKISEILNGLNSQNVQLVNVLSNIQETIPNKNSMEIISEKLSNIENVDYSYDFEVISSKIDNLVNILEDSNSKNIMEISDKVEVIKNSSEENLNNIFEKLENFSVVISSLKDLIINFDVDYKEKYSKQLEDFECLFAKVVNEDDFLNFRNEFSDFIKKLASNSDLLQINSDTNKELINQILEKVENFDYSEKLTLLDNKIDSINDQIETSVSQNCENLINEISKLKDKLIFDVNNSNNQSVENFSKVSDELAIISANVEHLKDLSLPKSSDILDNISGKLQDIYAIVKEDFDSNIDLDIQKLNSLVSNITTDLNQLKTDFIQKNDSNVFTISSNFDKVQLSLDNIYNSCISLSDLFNEKSDSNYNSILKAITDTSLNLENLKEEIHQLSTICYGKILDQIKETSIKLDDLSENLSSEISLNLSPVNEKISSFIDRFDGYIEENSQYVKVNNDKQFVELSNISENIINFKEHFDEISEGLKSYISELNIANNSLKSDEDRKFLDKLLDLESSMISSSDLYEQKFDLLQSKIAEFVHIVENSASDTEAKVLSSMEEVSELKNELEIINSFLQKAKENSDMSYSQILSVLDSGIESIINKISELNEAFSNGINSSFKESLTNVDEKFERLLLSIEDLKDSHSAISDSFVSDFEEKIAGLKQEFGLINTDISNIIQNKSEAIISSFEPIKDEIAEFLHFDFGKVLEELKSYLEQSFVNFSVDINGELASSSEILARLEQAYKELYNKINSIEDCISDKLLSDIELLNLTLEKSAKDIKNTFDEKFEASINELIAHLEIISDNTKLVDSIEILKDELTGKLDSLLKEQDNLISQNNVVNANISTLGDSLKNYVQDACENTIEKYSPIVLKDLLEVLNQKVDILANAVDASDVIDYLQDIEENINEKDANINDLINAISEKLEKIIENNKVSDQILSNIGALNDNISQVFNKKTDKMVSDIDALNSNISQVISNEDKFTEMLSALHEKVDILAMDDSDFDLEEEIDDIKDLIFEQRKYFEVSSDEKAAAIDKYLRDVLLKLDNVDLEKNSEDIKESIMNALVALFDQISFVEETEEIKDFVEEKTDEINQSLLEMQNQLKQIACSNDDFGYSYTLQDVETDIAKLRLAINNMSGNDFESLSDNIKKIVSSVEGLESSLTQDQVVDLKSDIEKLNEDILSISSRTNKILLSSDESYKALNEGLNNFSSLVYKLEDRINYLDNTAVSERLEKKIDNIQSMSIASANADKVFHQVMMYLGEWIDSTTENISSITEKTSEIADIKESIKELKEAIPGKSSILDELEEKFEQQELRIDRLEMKIEKILSALEQKDDMMLNRKVDKIEKLISRLGTNIEKLASYVDEE